MFTLHALPLLLVLPALLPATDESGLLANKCCPLGHGLDDLLSSCLPFPNIQEPNLERETVGQLRQRIGESVTFPSWMDNNTEIYDPDTEEIFSENFGYLRNTSEEAILRYGYRPCKMADTAFMTTSSKEKYKLFANGSLQFSVFRIDIDEENPTEDEVLLPPEEWCSDGTRDATPTFVFLLCPCERVTCVNRCCSSEFVFETESLPRGPHGDCAPREGVADRTPTFHEGRCYVAGPAPDPTDVTDTEVNVTSDLVTNATTALEAGASLEGDGASTLSKECENTTQKAITYTIIDWNIPSCEEEFKSVILNAVPSNVSRPWRTWLQRNGSVLIENFGWNKSFPRHHVCLERGLVIGGIEPEEVDTANFCNPIMSPGAISGRNIYYSLLFLIGSLFLLLTLVAHALVPALGRSPYVKALCCHCIALFVASVTISTMHFLPQVHDPYCSITAFIIQFFSLATFFWLNVMCFDVSWTFSNMRRSLPGRGSRNRRFLFYSLYAWVSPAIISAITIFMEYSPVIDPRNPMRPNIGVLTCWFMEKLSTLAYLYGPIAILLLANLLLFGITVYRIQNARKETSILRRGSGNARAKGGTCAPTPTNRGDGGSGGGPGGRAESGASSRHSVAKAKASILAISATVKNSIDKIIDHEQLAVFSKLFLLMGLTWATEFASWLADDESNVLLYVTDSINLLRGVVIFGLFCWKPPVVDPLRARSRAVMRRLGFLSDEDSQCTASSPTLDSTLSLSESNDINPAPEVGPTEEKL